MSVYTLTISAGASIGLIAGGAITQLLSWHWIFFINVPIGIATIVFGRAWIAENDGPGLDRNVDVLGSVTITAAMVLGAYAIVTAGAHGWGSAHTLGLGAAAVALIAFFWMLESRLANPIMPTRVFRIRGLAASSAIRGLFICGLYAVFFIGTLYMEHIRGFDALETGFAFLPQTIVLALLSMGPVAWLVGRFGPRPPLLVGLVCGLVAIWLLSRVHPHTAYFLGLLVPFLLMGLAGGLAFMPLLTIAMANVPPQRRRAGVGNRQHVAADGQRHRHRRTWHRLRRAYPDAGHPRDRSHRGAARRLPARVRGRRGLRGGGAAGGARGVARAAPPTQNSN
jgi:MFS family permease